MARKVAVDVYITALFCAMQRDFQITEARLGHGRSNWEALEARRSRFSSSGFRACQKNAVTTTSQNLKWLNKRKGGKAGRHPPPSHQPGEGWLTETLALQGRQGNGGRKTPASKCSQGSSTDPDSGSPRGLTDQEKEKGHSFWANLYHLWLTLPPYLDHSHILLCSWHSSVVWERWKLIVFPHLHDRTKACRCMIPLL